MAQTKKIKSSVEVPKHKVGNQGIYSKDELGFFDSWCE